MQQWRDGRKTAEDATEAVREAFDALGVPEFVCGQLRPWVTHTGKPYVNLGMVPAEYAERLAEALRLRAAR